MFYDVFLNLCAEFNVTPAKVRKDLGISQSTMASWKSRNLTPNAQTLVLLAEYFHTTPAYLMGNPMAKEPVDLEAHNQATKYYANSRFAEAQTWKARLEEIGQDLRKLNDAGQVEAVNRVKELTEIKKYQRPREQSPLSAGIKVYGDGPAGSFPPRAQDAPQPSVEPQEDTDTTPSPEGSEGPQEDE